MKKLFIIIFIGCALYLLKPDLFSFSERGAFDEEGNPQAWIFTFDECGKNCDNAVAILDKRVEYKEFNVSGESGRKQLNDIGGGNNFPLLVIGTHKSVVSEKMQIISVLAETLGTDVLTSREQQVMSSHFYDDNSPAVVMYGASWCGYCKKMRIYFDKNDIQYTELDAEGDAQASFSILNGSGFPLIYIGYRRINGANINLVEKTIKELNI